MSPLSDLIVGLKHGGRERNAGFLADLMAEALRGRSWLPEVDLLVPVPMHWKRRLQRRCNHALLLAEALGKRIAKPVLRAVRRSRYAPSQMRIERTSRAKLFANVAGCFAPRRRASVRGKTVCIVDNIVRSGATIHEVSKVLRKAGAKRIYAAIVARTVVPGDLQAQIDSVPSAPRPSVDHPEATCG
jgi:predicted amidophosphoribosyltransferase